MGQAKVRKKNGTYPTPEQMAQTTEDRRRWDTTIWFPTADDLGLFYVPEDLRPALRKRLEPWLVKMRHPMSLHDDYFNDTRLGVQGGHCWNVAQSLLLAANDLNVTLVEGVWMRPYELEEGLQPAPHTWCMVDGCRVDLVGEFYSWNSDDSEWEYEPLAEYTVAQFMKVCGAGTNDDGVSPEGFNISSYLWGQNGGWESLPEHLTKDIPFTKLSSGLYGTPEEHQAYDKQIAECGDYVNAIVFKPAIDRMTARCSATRDSK
jgi:hypothetical protein